jgi:glycosyltransferase involved in cell wall biosynthesis
MIDPLVSVVCLCYNQARFVREAIQSVLDQTYPLVQLIVLDDGSSDGSVEEIKALLNNKPEIVFIANPTNIGYTKSLNKALSYAKGELVIDLAADDVLLPTRIEAGVKELLKRGDRYGVNFSDAEIMDEAGTTIRKHSDVFPHQSIPEGDVYKEIIQRYFICPPTLMFRKAILEQMGGYDESLAFEDFDFLIYASRYFYFCYLPVPLVKKRVVKGSLSSKQFKRGSNQRISTLRVCEKIEKMNRSKEEVMALRKRVRYEILLSFKMLDFKLAIEFSHLYFRLSSPITMLT